MKLSTIRSLLPCVLALASAMGAPASEGSRWEVTGDALTTLVAESAEGGELSPPADLTLHYKKLNPGYYDGPAFSLDWKPNAPLDLSAFKRFSGLSLIHI